MMFEIQIALCDADLVFEDALPPTVGIITIDRYSAARLGDAKQFSEAFLAALQADGQAAEPIKI
ncbi:MAG: hypothetical protein ACC628_09170 [Pirellulaceae bacterium]